MKKVIMTIVVVGVAAIAAQAQTTKYYNTEAKAIMQERAQAKRVDTIQKAVEKETVRQARAQQRRERSAQADTTAAVTGAAAVPAQADSTNKTPAAPAKNAKAPQAKKSSDGCGVWECIKGVFGAGPLPGENDRSYSLRMESLRFASGQPYK